MCCKYNLTVLTSWLIVTILLHEFPPLTVICLVLKWKSPHRALRLPAEAGRVVSWRGGGAGLCWALWELRAWSHLAVVVTCQRQSWAHQPPSQPWDTGWERAGRGEERSVVSPGASPGPALCSSHYFTSQQGLTRLTLSSITNHQYLLTTNTYSSQHFLRSD